MGNARRQDTTPLIISGADQAYSVLRLERIRLETIAEAADRYDEAWLQRLIQGHPELLPITEIEPAFIPVIPVCLELPTPKGSIDNFFVTPTGNLVFAECKLWRNPEARRQVVAQVMDYIDSLKSWGYTDLENAVRRGVLLNGARPHGRFYELISTEQELDEPDFIDAVTRNLRLGRGLFVIVGDGIREETESLSDHLQAHAGIHFALALVELALCRLPNDAGILVQPRVIARTVNIERGIVRIDDTRISVEPPKATTSSRAGPLSEVEFYEQLVNRDPSLPERLRAFVARLEDLGVSPEFRRTLGLRWHAVDGSTLNVATIHTNGETYIGHVHSGAAVQLGVQDITRDYVRELAEAMHGEIGYSERYPDWWWIDCDGHSPQIEQVLEKQDAWVDAIERLAARVNERLEARDT